MNRYGAVRPDVQIRTAADRNFVLYRMGFMLNGMRAFYQIRYVPHGGDKK